MKNLIFKLIIICLILNSNFTTAQTSDEKDTFDRIDNFIHSNISVLSSDYLIFTIGRNYFVVDKFNAGIMYKLYFNDGIIKTVEIDSSFVLDNIFSGFLPKENIPKYVSQTSNKSKCPSNMIYFVIYNNGDKIFESWLPSLLLCKSGEINETSYPYDNKILGYFTSAIYF